MTNRIRIAFLALVAMAAVVAGGQHLSAQPIFSNPPCANITVTNNHPTCAAQVRFRTNPPVLWPALVLAPGGGTFNLPIAPGTLVQVLGVIDVNNVTHALNPPPAPIAVCGANAWWVTNVRLNGAAAACLFSVCVDPATCSITLW